MLPILLAQRTLSSRYMVAMIGPFLGSRLRSFAPSIQSDHNSSASACKKSALGMYLVVINSFGSTVNAYSTYRVFASFSFGLEEMKMNKS